VATFATQHPIPDLAALKAAIPAAKTDEHRAHVIKRAADLNLSHHIPSSWKSHGTTVS
jgi:hypothetical protein